MCLSVQEIRNDPERELFDRNLSLIRVEIKSGSLQRSHCDDRFRTGTLPSLDTTFSKPAFPEEAPRSLL